MDAEGRPRRAVRLPADQAHGSAQVRDLHTVAPEAGELLPLIDFTSGYVLRSVDALPKQGSTRPWRLHQSYPRDLILMRFGRLEDKGMRFASLAVYVDATRVPAT